MSPPTLWSSGFIGRVRHASLGLELIGLSPRLSMLKVTPTSDLMKRSDTAGEVPWDRFNSHSCRQPRPEGIEDL